ncbi:aldo/keto reductase [Microbacterium sp. ZXX196]|uniref:aldo/keto reductase n=1 Tax=Microbacterium sp. ZXX196 TaxID=2609291 RepID=UPI0034D25FB1
MTGRFRGSGCVGWIRCRSGARHGRRRRPRAARLPPAPLPLAPRDRTPLAPVYLPPIGFGVWQITGGDAALVIRHAIDAGYPLIDTASAYGNEDAVGSALRQAGGAAEKVQVTTKVWMADYDDVPRAVDVSRRLLGRDRIDTVLLHWPSPHLFDRTIRAWDALAALAEEGIIGSAGVSNFTPAHLDRLDAAGGRRPDLNQIERHPYFSQAGALAAHRARGIATQAYSPLGGPTDGRVRPAEDSVVAAVAEEAGASPAQVILAWHRAHGVSTIPRSGNRARIEANLASLEVALTPDQVARLDALETGRRLTADPDVVDEFTFA